MTRALFALPGVVIIGISAGAVYRRRTLPGILLWHRWIERKRAMSLQSSSHWYVDRVAWQLIGLRYLPWLTGFSLAWEIAQLPLYTLWREAPVSRIAFSVAHCTLGDALIGTSALVLALILTRAAEPARWRWMRIPVLTAVLAVAYTAFSEWLNTTILRSWSYSELMPVLRGAGIELGLAPLAQWMLLPPLVLRIVRPRF